MKRILLSIVVLLVLLCGVAVAETTIVASGDCGANVTWTLDSEGTLTISGEGTMYDYWSKDSPWYSERTTIKTAVIKKGVTSIGDRAFSGCSSLSSITIPDGVTSIDYAAFEGCSNLSSITIPDGVTSIGYSAFSGCSSLKKVYVDSLEGWLNIAFSDSTSTPLNYGGELYIAGELATDLILPEGVTSIGSYAFCNCSSLSSITIPDGVTSIGRSAFSECSSLSSITIPDGITSIGNYAFYGCSSLSSITIPDGVTSIGEYAFYNCRKLNSITIPDGITSIGNWAFNNCSSLKKVYADSLEGWLNIAFSGYASSPLNYGGELYIAGELVTDLVLPEGVTSIGDRAFSGCSSLSNITIPEGVTSIGSYAFEDCSSLRSITIPDGVTSIGNWAFSGCSSLKKVYADSLEGWLNIAFSTSTSTPLNYGGELYIAGELATDLILPEGVTSIGNYAFRGCSSLRSITIPDGVTSIGEWTFYNCSSLSSITIPDGVTSIGEYAFYGCSKLSSITIPDGVTSIGDSTFRGCSSLRSIAIPEGVTSIGEFAFYGCSNLRSITIPEGVTSIGSNTFYECSSLSSITLPDGVTSIGSYAFYNCSSLRSITIPEGVTSIGSYAFYGCSKLSSITIPDGVTSIGSYAFYNCSSLGSITIPDSVTSIGRVAFYGCSSLRSISLPAGVTSIGENAFSGCSSLRSITIPEGVTSIGSSAFYKCSSLRSISLPAGVTSIGSYAFYYCSSLRSITIPEGVTSIGYDAFSRCSSLRSISLPAGVTSIGDDAFYNCSNLRTVMFLGNDMPTLGSSVFYVSPTIYCYEFSDVDFWATEKGYTCVYIDNMDLNRPLSIDLPEDVRLQLGESYTVKPATFPQNANQGIVWQSSDPSVVSVENGVLTAHAVGEATITASCDEISDQMSVTVYAPVESFELSEAELWVVSKQSAQLEICDIEPVGATAYFTWESSDTAVLTVNGGSISALKPGDATVTVTSDNGIVRTCLVHVCYPVTGIELERSEYQMCLDGNVQIIANVTMRDQSCVNQLVTFASSDETVATVDQTGHIHAVSPGTATITVSATSGVSATCTVAVEPCTHIPVIDLAVPATHVTTGLTEGSHCSVCGEVLVAQQIVPIVEVEKVVLPAELEVIEAEAFAGDSFECVVLPEGCKAIKAGAFRDCAQLCFVEIPESVTDIDGTAFAGCSDSLIVVTVPSSEALCFAQEHEITCVLR